MKQQSLSFTPGNDVTPVAIYQRPVVPKYEVFAQHKQTIRILEILVTQHLLFRGI